MTINKWSQRSWYRKKLCLFILLNNPFCWLNLLLLISLIQLRVIAIVVRTQEELWAASVVRIQPIMKTLLDYAENFSYCRVRRIPLMFLYRNTGVASTQNRTGNHTPKYVLTTPTKWGKSLKLRLTLTEQVTTSTTEIATQFNLFVRIW